MSLLENWRETAYNEQNEENQKELWDKYFANEKGIYEKILSNPKEPVEGTVEGLAQSFGSDLMLFMGFLDGINESLINPLKLEELEEATPIKLEIDLEKLYYNMHAAKAEWLYELPQWENILTEEKRKEIKKEQRKSGTVISEPKIGRNEPCPCGSGKKYKKCCGAN